VTGVRVAAVGLVTGWGEGIAALPGDARAAAAGRDVIAAPRPPLEGDRFRRATRECLLGVAAVYDLLRDGGLAPEAIRGSGTAILYVTAGAYGASNRAFVESSRVGAPYFPYTTPSAVTGEVAIEFGLAGPYVILVGGAPATLDALVSASRLLRRGACARALVMAVETFAECSDLYTPARWLVGRPLVEAAACALLVPGHDVLEPHASSEPTPSERAVRRCAGETASVAPLIALALARNSHYDPGSLSGAWRERRARLDWTRQAVGVG
jgi:hypothetical protein